jgi:NAD(P)H-dependent FMN reductase
MYSVICATNRPHNQTQVVAQLYFELLKQRGINVNYFSLEDLPADFFSNFYEDRQKAGMFDFVKNSVIEPEKIILVSPEYNGSFPGILKLFIDYIHPSLFKDKKVALVGASNGRAGNVRGMDHLTNIFHYLQVNILPYKVPVSSLNKLIINGKIEDKMTIDSINMQLDKFISF